MSKMSATQVTSSGQGNPGLPARLAKCSESVKGKSTEENLSIKVEFVSISHFTPKTSYVKLNFAERESKVE